MAPIIFDWDEGNQTKNVTKHNISNTEAESVFVDDKKLIGYDYKHSAEEMRFECIGKSLNNRILRVTFVTRSAAIRVISARVASEKEKKRYEKQ